MRSLSMSPAAWSARTGSRKAGENGKVRTVNEGKIGKEIRNSTD